MKLTSHRVAPYRLALVVASVLVALALAEGGLRIVERVRLADRAIEANLIPDPLLHFRLAPHAIGHDVNGFRNDVAPTRVEIVAIGDSQTWGVNVDRSNAWPQKLAEISGRGVYNMALGGYGPVQYLVLADRSKKLSPKVIVVGIYLGNDIYDAYQMVYTNENYRRFRNPNAPPDLTKDTVEPRILSRWNEEKKFHGEFGRASPSQWSYWLREHLALGRLLNRAGLWPGSTDVDYEIDREWNKAHPQEGAIYEEGITRTVFTPAYRLAGLDLEEPRIAEGLRITEEILAGLGKASSENGAQLLVLLIPTKESVYADALQERLPLNSAYARLVEMESKCRNELLGVCSRSRIECVNALPALSEGIRQGNKLYPSTTDGHPNERGYFVLASTVNQTLARLHW